MLITIDTPLAWVALSVVAAAVVTQAVALVVLLGLRVVGRPNSAKMRDHSAGLKSLPYWSFWLVIKLMQWARQFQQLKPAPFRVAEVAVAYLQSQVLFAVVNLGVSEALRDGPKTADQLAAAAGPKTNPDWLSRVLKLAAELGLVNRTKVPGLSTAVCRPLYQHLDTPPPAATLNGVTPPTDSSSHTAADDLKLLDQDDPAGSTWAPFSCGYHCNDIYSANAVTAVLCRDHPNCMADFVKLLESHYAPFGRLSEGVATSRIPFKLWSGGTDFWQLLRESPGLEVTFDGAMRACNHTGATLAVHQYPWHRYDVVVDVGGGNGQFLAELLAQYPKLQGVLFDQHPQVERGKQWWGSTFQHLLPRMEFVAGDMFNAATIPQPSHGLRTVYVLKQILHDWSDAQSLHILQAIREVVPDKAAAAGEVSVLVLETGAMETICRPLLQHRLEADLTMLMCFGDGKERDEQQSRALLQAAGFTPGRLVSTSGLTTIMDATPAAQTAAARSLVAKAKHH